MVESRRLYIHGMVQSQEKVAAYLVSKLWVHTAPNLGAGEGKLCRTNLNPTSSNIRRAGNASKGVWDTRLSISPAISICRT